MTKRVATSPGAMAGGEEGGGISIERAKDALAELFDHLPGLEQFWIESAKRCTTTTWS